MDEFTISLIWLIGTLALVVAGMTLGIRKTKVFFSLCVIGGLGFAFGGILLSWGAFGVGLVGVSPVVSWLFTIFVIAGTTFTIFWCWKAIWGVERI